MGYQGVVIRQLGAPSPVLKIEDTLARSLREWLVVVCKNSHAKGRVMRRKQTPLRLGGAFIALVVLIGVFFLSPPVSANGVPPIEKDGTIQEDERSGGSGDGKNPGTDGEASDDGDEADPDWFGFTSWDGANLVETKLDPSEERSFLQLIGWLLSQVSNQYLSFWR